MSLELKEYVNNPLWNILVETVHGMVMYPHHKAYTKRNLLNERPNITPRELAVEMGMPLGEALVILYELQGKKK